MHLIADFGNTALKYFLFDEKRKRFKNGNLHTINWEAEITNLIDEYPIKAILICDVRGITEPAKKNSFRGIPVFYTSIQLKLPFTTAYKPPEQLGPDRIGLMAAACLEYPSKPLLAIDVGSCITYDFIDAKAHHHGGAIAPGFEMRYKSLHESTGKLPSLSIQTVSEMTGTSTQQAIHVGVFFGIVSEIEAQIAHYSKTAPDLTIILTGGDASRLLKRLKNTIFASSNFLAKGLNYILETNKNPSE